MTNKPLIHLLLAFIVSSHINAQTPNDSVAKTPEPIRKALVVYPLEKQLGYRSNLTRQWFTDIRAGLTFSKLPFITFELNRNKRFVNKEKVKVYTGIGLTLDSYIPGMQIPFGIEVIPLHDVKQLSLVAEVAPKVTLGPTNFFNVVFSPHLGVCYYLKTKAKK